MPFPTALAIVVASPADRSIDPVDVAKWSVQNGYCVEGNGSAHALVPDGGGHFIVLRGMTSSGKILAADPASKSRSEQEWALSIIVSEASRAGAVGGPFWTFYPPPRWTPKAVTTS